MNFYIKFSVVCILCGFLFGVLLRILNVEINTNELICIVVGIVMYWGLDLWFDRNTK